MIEYTHTLQINESHLDTFGHVNNATYVQLFEQARWEFITQNGKGLDYISQTQIGPVILGIELRFKKEVRNREQVSIKSHCERYKTARIKIHQMLFNQKNEVACEAVFEAAIFNMSERKAIKLNPEWLQACGIFS